MSVAADQFALPHEALAEPAAADPMLLQAEVITALSHALDLTEGQPPGHCLRTCWIGMHVGQMLGLAPATLSDLFYSLLLKDTGCSSNAARLWELYGGDELRTKQDFKLVDSQSLLQLAGFVLRHAGPGEAVRKRIKRLINLYRNGEALATELVHTRCERGADIVRRLGFGAAVSEAIFCLDEHWNGHGRPRGLSGEAIPLASRIALLAQVVDVFYAVGREAAAIAQVRRRSGSWFDPRICEAFLELAADPVFWSGLREEGIEQRVMQLEPDALAIVVDEERVDSIAEAFAGIIDAKSAFTYGHSQRVAQYADAVALELGLGEKRRRWLYRAALLHDLGKLGVSNAILDKPGALDAKEWEAVKRHASYTEEILLRVRIFRDLAPVAGAHHERPDGAGYPKRLVGDAISLETRIITVADIFDAITAARPYRGPMPLEQALALMERDRGAAIDSRCLDALKKTAPWLARSAP
ncbi:MAG TPA: HD domain-containing phosphohydrolase [Steroidobacteraceae bacterium]|nr:HD domain-containing phosphohydrolase [Steroidobacteraceae bacterium]